jgi:cellulose synthase/poly-beta-1,6-N-acetylglucosamine synthase-like glycosyltransferase
LLTLDYPADAWELIIVDDGGSRSLTTFEGEYTGRLPLRLTRIPPSGPAKARNTGVRMATGELLAFTDDDCVVEPDWLRQFAAGFADGRWDALGGRSLNPFPDNVATTAWHILVDFLYEYMVDDRGQALLLVSNNVAYRRSVYDALGGFDETFPWAAAEDRELSYRLLTRGYAQRYYPDARVWHRQRRLTPFGYIQQQFRYGRGSHYFERRLRAEGRYAEYQQLLGPRIRYRLPMWKSLRADRSPFSIWALLFLSHAAHRLGRYYQATRG